MDTLLILLGVLGFGAIIISVHVFSEDHEVLDDDPGEQAVGSRADTRNGGDRRSDVEIIFPLLVNGIMVHEDRRLLPDRRRAAA